MMADKTLTRSGQICLVADVAGAVTDGSGHAAAVALIAAINHARMGELRKELFLEMVKLFWGQIEEEEAAVRARVKSG